MSYKKIIQAERQPGAQQANRMTMMNRITGLMMELKMTRRKSLHWKLEDIMNHKINKLSNKVNIVVIVVHHSIQTFYDSIGTYE